MPTFCRHGRFEASCAICRQEKAKAEPKAVTPRAKGTTARRPASSSTGGSSTGSTRKRGVVTGKLQRAADDGFRSDFLPGVRSTADALNLAGELTAAEARLSAYGTEAAGPWAVVADLAGEPHKAFAAALVIAVASPDAAAGSVTTAGAALAALQAADGSLESLDAIGGATEAKTILADGPRGPRAHDATAAALEVPARLAQRSGGSLEAALAGEAAWSAERRFARLLDRLALPGLPRAVRFDLLTALGRSGALPVRADALHLGSDQVTDAAKRLFAVADTALLERRAAALVDATGVAFDALELALWNVAGADAGAGGAAARWSTAKPRTDLGLPGEADADEAQVLVDAIRD
ncbi:MAG: hypothetical protein J7513_08590 [Solirubrobacteraceae bacterium]|nr:hypothetical protein [Solirubrobacteraceae bacterium]